MKALPPTELRVSRDLHLRILDAVEDRQYTSQPGRARPVVAGVVLFLVILAGLAQFQRIRAEALAASAPVITSLTPFNGETGVSLDGQFLVQFSRMPAGTPTLRHLPPDGKQSAARWDGTNLIADYAGLRLGVRYQVILEGTYSSRTHDSGHFERRWSFTTQGAPRLAGTVPADGATTVPRYGTIAVDFNRRPTTDPVVTLQPPAVIGSGSWSGNTWTVHYSGLQPLTRYAAEVTVASGDPNGRIQRAWAFTAEAGAPPDGVPVVWYSTSNPWQGPSADPIRFTALDWSGASVGSLYIDGNGRQNADGSWVYLLGGGGAIDRQGRVVATGPLAVWSDISGRYCDIGFDAEKPTVDSSQWLEAGEVGGAVRRVALLGPPPGQTGFSLIACSGLTDRAVIGQTVQAGFLDVRVVALSTGRTLYRHAYLNGPLLVGSRDGRYVAENSVGSGPAATVIRRLSDGAVVATLADQRVIAFSWDGSRVVTAPSWGVTTAGEVRLLDWRGGAVLWRLAGNPAATGELPIVAVPQPGGKAFMVGVGNPTGSGEMDGLYLVQADGRADRVLSGSIYLAVNPG